MSEPVDRRFSATRWAAPPGSLKLDREDVRGHPQWVARDRCGVVALAPTRESVAALVGLRETA